MYLESSLNEAEEGRNPIFTFDCQVLHLWRYRQRGVRCCNSVWLPSDRQLPVSGNGRGNIHRQLCRWWKWLQTNVSIWLFNVDSSQGYLVKYLNVKYLVKKIHFSGFQEAWEGREGWGVEWGVAERLPKGREGGGWGGCRRRSRRRRGARWWRRRCWRRGGGGWGGWSHSEAFAQYNQKVRALLCLFSKSYQSAPILCFCFLRYNQITALLYLLNTIICASILALFFSTKITQT